MMGVTATGLAFALLAFSAGATTNCCGVGSACCQELTLVDAAANNGAPNDDQARVEYDHDRCCPDWGKPSQGCGAYDAVGCIKCWDVCDVNAKDCVLCSSSPGSLSGGQALPISRARSSTSPGGEFSGRDLWSHVSHPTEDVGDGWMAGSYGDGSIEDLSYGDDGEPGSYGAQDDDWSYQMDDDLDTGSISFSVNLGNHNCASCSWSGMSQLHQRLLTQRSRSMVCDYSCEDGGGDYGATLCNYFNAGKECRACCHEGHMVEGCMPCEVPACGECTQQITDICMKNPCGKECQAYVCCASEWEGHSGCNTGDMSSTMGELASYISEACSMVFECHSDDMTCSDNARTCRASPTVGNESRKLQEMADERCSVVGVNGAGSFDNQYKSVGSHGSEASFTPTGSRHKQSALQSVEFDACTETHTLPSMSRAATDIIVARSTSGRLVWNDNNVSDPHTLDVGCSRHVWLMLDTTGSQSYAYVTVDPCEEPQHITSDWVMVRSSGEMSLSKLALFCIPQLGEGAWKGAQF